MSFEEMKTAAKKKGVSPLILMLTDVLLEGSQLLYVGGDDVISQAFGVTRGTKKCSCRRS